jgi:hypothetical protein
VSNRKDELREKIEFQVAMAMNSQLEIEKSTPVSIRTAEWQDRTHKLRKDITAQILQAIKEAGIVSPEEIEAIRAEERREIFNLLEGYRTGDNEKGMLYTIPFHVWKEFREALKQGRRGKLPIIRDEEIVQGRHIDDFKEA